MTKEIENVEVEIEGLSFDCTLSWDGSSWGIADNLVYTPDGNEINVNDWSLRGRALRQHILDSAEVQSAIEEFEADEIEGDEDEEDAEGTEGAE